MNNTIYSSFLKLYKIYSFSCNQQNFLISIYNTIYSKAKCLGIHFYCNIIYYNSTAVYLRVTTSTLIKIIFNTILLSYCYLYTYIYIISTSYLFYLIRLIRKQLTYTSS